MWIVTNHGYLSIVAHRGVGFNGMFLVRARRKEDLYHFFGDAKAVDDVLIENPDADYQYRVIVEADTLKAALFRQVDLINYGNFKNSIPETDDDLRKFAAEVWVSGWRNLSQDKPVDILRIKPVNQRTVESISSVNKKKKDKSRR